MLNYVFSRAKNCINRTMTWQAYDDLRFIVGKDKPLLSFFMAEFINMRTTYLAIIYVDRQADNYDYQNQNSFRFVL